MSCNFSENLDRFYELLGQFPMIVDECQYGGLPRDLRFGFKRLLKQIATEFNNLDDQEALIASINEYLEADETMQDFMEFLPDLGVAGTIAEVLTNNDSKVDENLTAIRIEDPDEFLNLKDSKTKFIDDLFGTKVKIKDHFVRKASNLLLDAFVINRSLGKLILNAEQANEVVRNIKNKLWKSAIEYLKLQDPSINISEKIYGLTESLKMDAINNFTQIANRKLNVYEFAPNKLESLYEKSNSGEIDANTYDHVEDFLVLKYFDNCVQGLLGDVVVIDPNDSNPYSENDKYSFKLHGSNVINTWRSDENIVLENEINLLSLLLINTTPLYDYKSKALILPTSYLKFGDFYQIVAKIKNEIYTNPALDNDENDNFMINGHTLKWNIQNIRLNPQKYLQDLFEIIATNSSVMNLFNFTPTEKNKLYSLYKGVFSTNDTESVNAITQKLDYTAPNYYNLLTQVADCFYTVEYLQYYEDENNDIYIRSLSAIATDNTKRALEKRILYNNSRKGNKFALDSVKYGILEIPNSSTHEIVFKLDINNISYNITSVSNGTSFIVFDDKGNKLNTSALSALYNSTEFLKFIDDLLTLNLSSNGELKNSILNKYKGNIEVFGNNLLTLATHIMYNKFISNVHLKNFATARDQKAALKSIYLQNPPIIDSQLNEMRMLSNEFLPKLNEIVASIEEVSGVMESGLVKDGDGNAQSLYTLSRLLGSLPTQYMLIQSNPSNTASDFSLLQLGVNKGHYTSKEFFTPTQNKSLTKFTVKESIISSFLYDYIFGLTDKGNNDTYIGNKTIAIYPDVNSDKSTIGKLLIDLNKIHKRLGKSFADMNPEELSTVISLELGTYYTKLLTNILQKYNTLYEFIRQNYPEELEVPAYTKVINPNNSEQIVQSKYILEGIDADLNSDFKQFNNFAKKRGLNARQLLRNWTKLYNDAHKNDLINFTDKIYYEGSGDIYMNTTIRDLSRRFASAESVEEFFKYKEAELVKLWLEEDIQISLSVSEKAGLRNPAIYLKGTYKDWTDDSNNLIYAKITMPNGQIQNVTKLESDLLTLFENPHDVVLSGYKIELHPELKKYNRLDYLFSQEFILSGVGTHAAHPNKAALKNEIPIIWGHSALGKTTFLNSGAEFSNLFADWDDYFNTKRDQFFAKKAGITGDALLLENNSIWENNPTYAEIRNNCMVLYKDPVIKTNPIVREYIAFVELNWKAFVDLCRMQNKAVLASPGILLDITRDYIDKNSKYKFTALININLDNAIKRLAQVLAGQNNEVTNEHIANATSWKNGIDGSINNYLSNPINKPKNIDGTNRHMSELIPELTAELFTLLENAWANEGDRYIAQIKRNVSYTAQMHEFQLNQIDGIPTNYKIAVIEDIKDTVHTVSGKIDKATPFDGATFVNPLTVYWENNSLKGDRAGLTKKLFIHFYDEHDGTGGIIKTAGFAGTNDKIKKDLFYRNLVRKMLDVDLINKDGSKFLHLPKGILLDFEGKTRSVGPIYFKSGNKYVKRIIQDAEYNTYTVLDIEVSEHGTAKVAIGGSKTITADNTYQLYLLLGGWESLDFSNGVLKSSEKSIEMLADIGHYYGYKTVLNGVLVRYQDDVWQPIKQSVILYLVTMGAIKHGAANINTVDRYTDDKPFLTMNIKTLLAGILLDKEHHAENETLSLMTLVISAAIANGFTFDKANSMYNALYSLTKLATNLFRNELGEFISDDNQFNNGVTSIIFDAILHQASNDLDMLQAITANTINLLKLHLDWLKNPNSTDVKTEIGLSIADFLATASDQLPYSNNAIYKKVVSTLASCMTKAGIKIKMPGVLAVLNPTHSITKFYKVPVYIPQYDKKSNKLINWVVKTDKNTGNAFYQTMTYGLVEDLLALVGITSSVEEYLAKLLREYPLLINLSADIQIGKYYNITKAITNTDVIGLKFTNDIKAITVTDGTVETNIQINSIDDLNLIKQRINSGEILVLNINLTIHILTPLDYAKLKNNWPLVVSEDVRYGSDLDTYNVRFKGIDGASYLLFDLDIVLDYFALENSNIDANKIFEKYNIVNTSGVEARKALHVIMQASLRALSTNDSKVDRSLYTVKINKQDVLIDPLTIKVQPYGIIMPKLFASKMHLDENTSINDVVNDPRFFEKELEKRWATKVETYIDNNGNEAINYQMELKRADGNHIYICSADKLAWTDLHLELEIIKRETEDGRVLMLDVEGNVILELASPNDRIFVDYEGNQIIVTEHTDNFLFYLDNSDYIAVTCNPKCLDDEFMAILNGLVHSTNSVAKEFGELFLSNNWTLDELLKKLSTLGNLRLAKKDSSLAPLVEKHLNAVSSKLRTSFLKSLDIIGARIPALSMQSFMAMKVASFDNPNLNNAYVSLTLFYLQGSKKINTTPLA